VLTSSGQRGPGAARDQPAVGSLRGRAGDVAHRIAHGIVERAVLDQEMTELERAEHEHEQHGHRERELHDRESSLAAPRIAFASTHESSLPALLNNSMTCGPVAVEPAPGLPPDSQPLMIWP